MGTGKGVGIGMERVMGMGREMIVRRWKMDTDGSREGYRDEDGNREWMQKGVGRAMGMGIERGTGMEIGMEPGCTLGGASPHPQGPFQPLP